MRVSIVVFPLVKAAAKRDQASALGSLCPELGRAGGILIDHLPGEGLQLAVWPVICIPLFHSTPSVGHVVSSSSWQKAEDLQEEVAQAVCCYSQVHGVQAIHHYVFHLEARCWEDGLMSDFYLMSDLECQLLDVSFINDRLFNVRCLNVRDLMSYLWCQMFNVRIWMSDFWCHIC